MNAEKKHKIIRTSFILFVFVLFAFTFWPFITELLLAALFAFSLHDLMNKITKKSMKRQYASLIITLGVLIFIATPLVFITLKTITTVKNYSITGIHNTEFYQSTEKIVNDVTARIATIANRFDIDASKLPNPTDFLTKYSGVIGTYATKFITKVPDITLSLFVFFLGLYYFLSESQKIKTKFLNLDLLSEIETNGLIKILKYSSYHTLVISLLIASIQACIIGIFAYFSGFTDFFLIFIITFVFALVPVVGSAPMPAFLMLISFMQGNTGAAIALLVAGLLAGSIDNLIKPILLSYSGSEDLPPIISLITLIGAILVYGAVGILIGPIITQLALNILDILQPDNKSGEIAANPDF